MLTQKLKYVPAIVDNPLQAALLMLTREYRFTRSENRPEGSGATIVAVDLQPMVSPATRAQSSTAPARADQTPTSCRRHYRGSCR